MGQKGLFCRDGRRWRSSLQHLGVGCGRRVLAQLLREKGGSERNTQDQGKGLVSSRKVVFLQQHFVLLFVFSFTVLILTYIFTSNILEKFRRLSKAK